MDTTYEKIADLVLAAMGAAGRVFVLDFSGDARRHARRCLAGALEKVVLAERERCAKVAIADGLSCADVNDMRGACAGERLAAAIRTAP